MIPCSTVQSKVVTVTQAINRQIDRLKQITFISDSFIDLFVDYSFWSESLLPFSLDAATSRLSNDFESSLSTADKTFGGYKVDRDCLSASAVDCLHQGTFLLSLVVLMLLFLL